METTQQRSSPGPFPAAVSRMPAHAAPLRRTAPAWAAAGEARRPLVGTSREQLRVERDLGRRLLHMKRSEGFRPLGYVRLGDYAGERLGLTLRTAQELMRAAEALDALPLLAAALERGEVTWGHVRVLTRIATAADEAAWVDRAKRRSVRQLARDVAIARGGPEGPAPDAPRKDATAGAAAEMIDPRPELERLEISAPAWISSMWREVKVIVRRLAGSMLPAGACLEIILAESGAAALLAGAGALDEAPGTIESPAAHEAPDVTAPAVASGVGGVATTSTSPVATEHPGGIESALPTDPRALDAEMRELATARQREEAALADALAEGHRWRSFRTAGFESLEAFALERFGLPPRRLYYLLALHRELDRLPDLRRAFVSGRLTLRRALRVAAVSTPATAEAWIRRAESVKLRRLEDEIDFWQHLRDTRYAVWRLLQGRPLPEGIVLVPGRVPRLRAGPAAGIEAGDNLHAFSRATVPDAAPPAPGSGFGSSEQEPGAGSDLHAFSFVPVPGAAEFLAALEADEELTPLPERRCRIRMLVEPDVGRQWRDSVAALRANVRPGLEEGEALALLMREFLSVWDNKETRRQAREHPTLERDGWRCTAPGCTSVGSGKLHEHHIEFRSSGGAVSASSNVTTLCAGHHLGLLHRGIVRLRGRAPDALIWEMGIEPGNPERGAFLVYAGDKLVQ